MPQEAFWPLLAAKGDQAENTSAQWACIFWLIGPAPEEAAGVRKGKHG
jgi:hypothetical protein